MATGQGFFIRHLHLPNFGQLPLAPRKELTSFQPDGNTFKSIVGGSLTGAANPNPPGRLVFER